MFVLIYSDFDPQKSFEELKFFGSCSPLLLYFLPRKGSSGKDKEPRRAHRGSTRASQARIRSEDLPYPYMELC